MSLSKAWLSEELKTLETVKEVGFASGEGGSLKSENFGKFFEVMAKTEVKGREQVGLGSQISGEQFGGQSRRRDHGSALVNQEAAHIGNGTAQMNVVLNDNVRTPRNEALEDGLGRDVVRRRCAVPGESVRLANVRDELSAQGGSNSESECDRDQLRAAVRTGADRSRDKVGFAGRPELAGVEVTTDQGASGFKVALNSS